MQPQITPLLEAAREIGQAVHPGKRMLEDQLSVIKNFLLNDVILSGNHRS